MTNPFFTEWNTKYKAIPYHLIKKEHFMPAIEKGIELAYQKLEEIKLNKEIPNFENTILALDEIDEALEDPVSVYFNLMSVESDNEFKTLAEKISPLLAQLATAINTDKIIFTKLKAIYESPDRSNLTLEQSRLLEKKYKSFVRNGALLDDEKKDELRAIDQEMSVLSPQFSKNLLAATNAYHFHTTDPKDIDGLPENDIKAATFRAKEKGYDDGWVFNLQFPSYGPAMTYLKNREIRKKLSIAYSTRSLNDAYDNQNIILKEVNLRQQRAKLLGYKNHSHYVLEERMAENPETVEQFLERIFSIAMPIAKKEISELKEYAKKIDDLDDFMGWDSAYYSEKLKKEKFGYDSEELRPYFKVENCLNGIFKVAEKLYGLKFEISNEYPVYHEDVKVYEVLESNGDFLGLLYIDLFPRVTKNSGAWMNPIRGQGIFKGQIERPHILMVGNFTPSTEKTPSLLTLSEVDTLFHEFGHALHGLLSKCTYKDLSGTNVFWDFVELPSQIMENWVLENETLSLFAYHYQTGEIMPEGLINKIKSAQNFNKGIFNIRQLNFGMLDMGWHNTNITDVKNVVNYEEKIIEKLRLLPKIENTCISTSFSHIFSGGYSSGYYSYKWAEVLDADAFEKFKEDGIFNRKTAESFRDNILSKGNTEHPMSLYIKFRGRKPDPDAMLRRDGLL